MTKEEAYLMKMRAKMDLVSYGTFLSTYHAAKIKFSDVAPEKAGITKKAIRLARKLIAKKRQPGYMIATTAQMLKAGHILPARQFEIRPKPGVKARWYVAGGVYRRGKNGKLLFNAFVAWEKYTNLK